MFVCQGLSIDQCWKSQSQGSSKTQEQGGAAPCPLRKSRVFGP